MFLGDVDGVSIFEFESCRELEVVVEVCLKELCLGVKVDLLRF